MRAVSDYNIAGSYLTRVPAQAIRQMLSSEFEVNDTSTSGSASRGRCVDEKRPHQDGVAPYRNADNLRILRHGIDLRIGQQATCMRSRQNPQRAIVWSAIVQIDPNRYHPLQHGCWRPHMGNPRLHRPRAPPRHVCPTSDCNHTVLMPRYFPIGHWVLVEEDATNRKTPFTKDRRDPSSDGIGTSKP